MPLFHVLALNCHFLIPQYYTSFWSQLTGLPVPEDFRESVVQSDKEVPLLLVDTCAMLIQLLFALPLNVDEKYYDSIVQNLYNLTAVQALSQITGFFSEDERSVMLQQASREQQPFDTPMNMIGYIAAAFESANPNLFRYQDEPEAAANRKDKAWKTSELTDLAVNMVLPFVRMAALLKCSLYNREYPSFAQMSEEQLRRGEYLNLARILNLNTASSSDPAGSSFLMPHFTCDQPTNLVDIWLNQYTALSENSLMVAIVSFLEFSRRIYFHRLPLLFTHQSASFAPNRNCSKTNRSTSLVRNY